VNKRTTYRTSVVFNHSWREKRGGQRVERSALVTKKRYPMRGIKSDVYPRERVIHVFQTPFVIQEHQEVKNSRDKLLLMDLGNSSSLEFVNS
jgi:hypothetical protein